MVGRMCFASPRELESRSKILQETQQDELFLFLHVQAQAVFDVATFEVVIDEVIEGE